VKAFDVHTVPLEGVNLIEAAAGTGKTYSIEHLFLRLLLEKGLRAEEILAVTFTQAAAAELRQRIHTRLLEARNACAAGAEKHSPVFRTVSRALADFDRAAVFTIHGFCQRLLSEHAFETGSSFDCELITDQTPILREIVEDYWRLHLTRAPRELIAFALERLRGPEQLLRFLVRIKAPGVRLTPETGGVRLSHLQPYREALARLRAEWPQSGSGALALLQDAALNASVYGAAARASGPPGAAPRTQRLLALQTAMEAFLAPETTLFPPFPGLQKLTAGYLASKTLRGGEPPRHAVFELCEAVFDQARALEEEMAAAVCGVKAALVDYARVELASRKRARNLQSFDDLLLAVSQALSSPQGAALARGVRRRYRAVLVDEFQDTDDLQYAIFSGLFSQASDCLFWIGDPKQAIYGFRGADIFSYLKAARNARNIYTLGENRRSAPRLVAAVNAVFSGRRHPFLFEEIAFAPGKPAGDGASGPPALKLWYLDSRRFRADGHPVTSQEARALIARAVAAEIRQLMRADGAGVPAGDMAVLVRTNEQARIVKEHLSAAGIPSVVCSTGSVFDSHEAVELQRVLASICEPTDAGRLKAALSTDMLGAAADELAAGDADPDRWEERYARQRAYHERWQRDGFMPMFRALMAGEQVKLRLLAFEDGERRLTNVLHLAELLHQAAAEGHLGMAGLNRWLCGRRKSPGPGPETHQLRLESDEHAVKIVTIHKSKGLEYRVVFCAYAWSGSTIRGEEVVFHDPADGHRLTIDLGGEEGGRSRGLAEDELLAENLRLLYVALTRARERCYLVWGRINTSETSALAYLFHCPEAAECGAAADGRGAVAALAAAARSRSDEELISEVNRLVDRSAGSIEALPLPEGLPHGAPPLTPPEEATLACRRFRGGIDRSWKTASYSRLVAAAAEQEDAADRDRVLLPHGVEPVDDRPAAGGGAPRLDIFSFPGGSRAGIFFHSLLEEVEFRLGRHADTDALIDRSLSEHGYPPEWRDTVAGLIEEVSSAPFVASVPDLILARVPAEARVHEMEFHHPLKLVTPRALQDAFRSSALRGQLRGFPELLGRLSFAPTRGFMKGYIDMVLEHRGRYYLFDWKSNHLGGGYADYQAERLAEAMMSEFYVLQYHIYCLALHLYLRGRLPGYKYERDFGGAGYVFLRGVRREGGPGQGVFFDRPSAEMIHALGEALIPDYGR
jgi:exodeoxyribonuclease V beta subunit